VPDHFALETDRSAITDLALQLNDTVLALNKSITNLSDRVRGLERKLPKLDTTFRSSVYQYNNTACMRSSV
jgi:hypothetical protein